MNWFRSNAIAGLIGLLAVAGAGVSGYLTYTHWADTPVICGGRASCATVQSSEYASVAGIPVALLGLFFYATIAVLAVAVARHPAALAAIFGLALSGVLYSAYLTWVEIAVLEAICLWCVASAVVVSLIAAVSGVAVLRPARPASAAPAVLRA